MPAFPPVPVPPVPVPPVPVVFPAEVPALPLDAVDPPGASVFRCERDWPPQPLAMAAQAPTANAALARLIVRIETRLPPDSGGP